MTESKDQTTGLLMPPDPTKTALHWVQRSGPMAIERTTMTWLARKRTWDEGHADHLHAAGWRYLKPAEAFLTPEEVPDAWA